MIPQNHGIIMVAFVPEHFATRRRDATINHVLNHLFYIAERIGWDHVGLGPDFDGIASRIPGLDDIRCYSNLYKVSSKKAGKSLIDLPHTRLVFTTYTPAAGY